MLFLLTNVETSSGMLVDCNKTDFIILKVTTKNSFFQNK